ncbi:MAG: VCBS repeat-containing protein [Anaerolineae bacterium]|nr:VCBS repeat-containing protein [Anaerolineae bacterium]
MNKYRACGMVLVALIMLAMPLAGLWGRAGLPTVVAQTTTDEEIVYLDSSGRIKVSDPYVPAGKEAVVWQSSDTGWYAVVTGDFNGDGDDEILAIKGSTAKVFDPVVQRGEDPVVFQQSAVPYVWERAATGDIDGDGRDEIILTRSDYTGSIREHLTVWDGGEHGTAWTEIRDNGYGWPWDAVALGDVNGDGRDDIAMIRYYESMHDRRLMILNPVNWTALHDKSYDFPWLNLAIGNTDKTTGTDVEEIVLTREKVVAALNSYLVMRWRSGSSSLDTVHGEKFYPYFTGIALGDVNNSGDVEVFLLRDPETTDGVSLIMRNYGADAVPGFEERIGRNWKAVRAGDVDGDGKAEAVILSASQIRIYTSPDVNKAYTTIAGSFRTIGPSPIALGNLDGEGISPEPELGVSPTSIVLQMEIGEKTNRYVDVSNIGTEDAIAWTATVTAGSDWLSITPTSGNTPGQITLSIDTTTLSPGTYVGKVRVTADGVIGSPKDVTVTLTAQAPPFSVTPTKISLTVLSGQPYEHPQINVQGNGIEWIAGAIPAKDWDSLAAAWQASGKLEHTAEGWRAGDGADAITVPDLPWLILTPYQGTAPSIIYISIDESKISPGLHRATIIVDGGPSVSPRFHSVDFTLFLANYQNFVPGVLNGVQ